MVNDVKPDTEVPTQPQALYATKVTVNSIELSWNSSTDNVGVKEYQILRDGKVINTVPAPTFTDKNLTANTEYIYTVKALDTAGNVSKESKNVVVKTTNETPDTEAPTQPKGLHNMGVTSSSIDLMWSPSDDNIAVDHYAVYRETLDGKMVVVGTTQSTSFTDKNLQPNTTYKYTVTAVDKAGNESVKSNILTATTKEQGLSYEQWDPYKAYKKEDRVEYQGKIYEAVQSYQGNGDSTWISALSLWKAI